MSQTKSRSFDRLFVWLGRRDSNPRMPVPKTGALPLGDALLWYINIVVDYRCKFYPKSHNKTIYADDAYVRYTIANICG